MQGELLTHVHLALLMAFFYILSILSAQMTVPEVLILHYLY